MTSTIARVTGMPRRGIPLGGGRRLYLFVLNVSSYSAGGEVVTAAALGIQRVDHITPVASVPTTAANRDSVASWDKANNKIFICVMSTGLEAGAVALGTYELHVIGR